MLKSKDGQISAVGMGPEGLFSNDSNFIEEITQNGEKIMNMMKNNENMTGFAPHFNEAQAFIEMRKNTGLQESLRNMRNFSAEQIKGMLNKHNLKNADELTKKLSNVSDDLSKDAEPSPELSPGKTKTPSPGA